jgi:hypothetical protein
MDHCGTAHQETNELNNILIYIQASLVSNKNKYSDR